jgi:hypothetical protein
MDTQGLPREEWGAFFDDLSREFEQGQVTVEVSGDGLPHVMLIENLPLLGLQFNTKGSDAGSITIMAGQDEDAAISHTITGPTQVNVARDAHGAVAAIQIDAPDPAQTRIHFLSSI